MDKINLYEYSGIICPGAIFLTGVYLLHSDFFHNIQELRLGEFGLFIILSFCIGHIIQGIANIFELIPIFNPHRHTEKLLQKENIKKEQLEIYRIIVRKGKIEKLEIFNRLYGLMRGLCISLLLIAVFAIYLDVDVIICVVIFVVSGISFYRAVHFSNLYTKELIGEYNTIIGLEK
jgi:cytochrome b subunit of formate dehydrogenase